MVKKNYVAPATNESRTKLRATILAGSTQGTGAGLNPGGPSNTGNMGTGDDITNGGPIPDARQRSASSLD